MNYIVKWPNGATDDASLDGIRSEFKTGGVTEDCTVRRSDSQTWQTVRELLESLGDLKPQTEEEIAARASGKGSANAERASRRYRDAYLVASACISFATIIKLFGWLVAVSTWIAGFVFAFQSRGAEQRTFFFAALILGVVQLMVFYFFGIIVAASGQILRASLDTAVHSSPFLDTQQKASAMGV